MMIRPLIKPRFLKAGSLIRIVAPAGKIPANTVYNAINGLYSAGYRVIAGSHVFDEYHQFAGIDEDRLEDLQEAFDDPDCEAILIARGGYGLVRIIDQLDLAGFINCPKWVLGFSDVTILHSHLHIFGYQSVHSAMCAAFTPEENSHESIETFFRALNGSEISYQFSTHHLNRIGNCRGLLTGGNIAILSSCIGSASDIDTAGKILFLEDLGEYLYRLDRMMYTLKRGGKLSHLAGLLVGGLTGMKDGETPFGMDAEQIILNAVKEYDYPVCFGFPSGHQHDNRALVLGSEVLMEVTSENSSLKFLD
jgi:muramoyltetrapeptide carboxypeptidase